MKPLIFIIPVLFAFNAFSQNQVQTNISNINVQQQRYIQLNQVFASNVMTNNANKPLRANANPQVNVQRVSNVNQQRQTRRRVNVGNVGNANPIQTNINNVLENNMNTDIQMQENFSQQADNNLGNAPDSYRDGNEGNIIEQIASVSIPAIQLGNGSLNLNLDINLPKINLKSIKFSSHKSVSTTKHKTFYVKNKLAKLNRKMTGKLSFGKKLKIKVDNCFKW